MSADDLRFAVYLVPPPGPYYQLGSQLLGYDLRARCRLPLPDFLDDSWQREAGPYGFHLTVVEGFYTGAAQLGAIEAEWRTCLACFSPQSEFALSAGRLEVWDDGAVWVHRFDPSPTFAVLHTLLLARLAPFATGTPFVHKARPAFQEARLRLLRTPRGLDTYQPHFTLVQPYGGHDPGGLSARLGALLTPFSELAVSHLALCYKPAGEELWQIRAEAPIGQAD